MNLIDHLLALLERQQEALLRLQALSREERNCLLESRLDRLEEITLEQQDLLATQSQLSTRITQVLARVGAEQQLSGRVTLARVAAALSGAQAGQVQSYYREITGLADDLQREGRVNWYLSQQAIKYIDFTLQLLCRAQEGPALYGPVSRRTQSRPMQLLMDSCA